MSRRSAEFKKRLQRGEAVVGAWLSLNDISIAEIMATTGFDYILIDTEHATFDLASLKNTLIAFNGVITVPIVRVAWNDPVRIKQVLDMGADGIVAPMVRTVDDVKALVAACKYPPAGIRGFGPLRASNYYRNIENYRANSNDEVFIMPQIEHIDTVALVDEFLDSGVDAICLGPNDLSGSLGLLGQFNERSVKKAIDQVLATAKARNAAVCPGVTASLKDQAKWLKKGVRMLLATSDVELLTAGAQSALDMTRAKYLA